MQSPVVLFKIIGHVLCIIDMTVGHYTLFNHTGSQIWLDVMQGKETSQNIEALHRQYPDSAVDAIANSVDEFMETVQQKNLVAFRLQPQQLDALSQEIAEELGDFVPGEFIPPQLEDVNTNEFLASLDSISI